jgi:hypothetical protein
MLRDQAEPHWGWSEAEAERKPKSNPTAEIRILTSKGQGFSDSIGAMISGNAWRLKPELNT